MAMRVDLKKRQLDIGVFTLIGLAVLGRLAFAEMPNLSPISALALFSGACLADRKQALIIPLVAMLVSDVVLGFHSLMPFVYLAFALIVLLGIGLAKRLSISRLIGASLLGSIGFFLISNFGVWLLGLYYPMTMAGLLACYVAALPFFQMTVLGDLLFVGLLFGGLMAWKNQWQLHQPT